MDWEKPEDIIDIGKNKFSQIPKVLPVVIIGAVFLLVLLSSIYSIGPDEVGVVQRLGKYVYTTGPGLHLKLPLNIEKVTPVKVQRVFKEEFGVRTLRAGVKTQYSRGSQYANESLMLTGDLNILDVKWIVQFKVKDPVKLLFKTRDPQDNVRDVAEVVMRRLVGDYNVDEILTAKREEVNQEAQKQMQELLDKYNTGIYIVTVKLQDVNPPDEVKPAFNEVNEAKQEKERLINQAWEEYNRDIPRAKGEAERTIRESEGYSLDKVNRAQGDVDRFTAMLEEYKKAPTITRKRIYLDTMQEIMPKAKQKYIIDSEQKSILPFLNVGQEGRS